MARKVFSEYQSKAFLRECGIEFPQEFLATSKAESAKMAEKMGFPVVLKGCGEGIAHKTEKNLVRLNLKDKTSVESAYEDLTSSGEKIDGIIVQKFVPGKREFIAGILKDQQFGYCVMFGLGGIFTEILRDVTFRLSPISTVDAEEMLHELKHSRLLGEFRGEQAINMKKLLDLLCKLSEVPLKKKNVIEVDLNPLIPWENNIYIVDALVVTEDEGKN